MRVTGKGYGLFAEAWLSLAVARLTLVFIPFKRIVPLLKQKKESHLADIRQLEQVQLAIARACVRSPWRTKCFEQALAAKMMLNRRRVESKVYFGVRKGADKPFDAHAWVESGAFIVTGWQQMQQYVIVVVL